jgi:predicted SprT family Zn-dependent metalloprotease
MQVEVIGLSQLDKIKINYWHQEFCNKVYSKFPDYKKLKGLKIKVKSVKNPNFIGNSKLDYLEIEINEKVLKEDHLFKEVYAHELGHMFSCHFFKKNTGHSLEWKKIVNAMEMPANETW